MNRRFPLHVHISTLFLTLILIVGGIIGGLGYTISRDILESTESELNSRITRETISEFSRLVSPAEMASRLLSFNGITQANSLAARLKHLELMREALNTSVALTSIYVGYANGDFFLLRRLQNDNDRKFFKPPEKTAYIVQSIERQAGRGRFIYLDQNLATLRSDDRPDYPASYDPRSRSWYQAARLDDGLIQTAPYLFFTNGRVGTTLAKRASNADAVVGSDILIDTLNDLLAKHKVTPGSQVVLANRLGQAIAYEDFSRAVKLSGNPEDPPVLASIAELGSPVLARLAPLLEKTDPENGQALTLAVDGAEWHASIRPLQNEASNPIFLVTAIPDLELMAASYTLMRRSLVVMALVILIAVPITWAMARGISGPLRQLAAEAEAIRRFEFSQPIKAKSLVLEVNDLTLTMDSMKRTIRRFLDINMAVSAENNFDRLLPRLLSETISAADADAGILYLSDNDKLMPAAALRADGTELPAATADLDPAAAGPLFDAALLAGSARSAILLDEDIRALGLDGLQPSASGGHAIAVPLLNRQQALVGAMLLLRHDEADSARLNFIEALSGSAAITLENKALIKEQKALFEAFIQLIAGAIDAKSPYTGGHCARVPEITKMLARAACAESSGPYKDFALDDAGWEAVHVAAWLHDCGKVTTPEYVVDKATKLETLYDRIHEIRMRFEVLKRDAEIACLKAIVAGETEASARARLTVEHEQLDDDFTFIATCNEGGEFMAAEQQERLRSIAERRWLRTLDDRIGISHEEGERKARQPRPALPVAEPLLADKPEHLFERRAQDRMPRDNKWGIRMPVPELLYNKGELYNLAVARGTLSEEERYKINEHIVQTLIMLGQLPFPKHLRQVPEIAGGHHEKMDGTGYPKRLHKEEMSPVARMMAIADIFEALTAVDRPYKKGKKLSEALQIMARMRDEAHIDPELFDLFLTAGVWREYAERFMRPEQIDAVDTALYARHPSLAA